MPPAIEGASLWIKSDSQAKDSIRRMRGTAHRSGLFHRARIALLYAISLLPDFLCAVFYRTVMGARIGPGFRIGLLSVLDAPSIDIGPETSVGRFVRVTATRIELRGQCRIGTRTRVHLHRLAMAWRATLDEEVLIWGDPEDENSQFAMGMHSWVFPFCVVNVSRPVVLRRNVGLGGRTLVFTHGFWLSQLEGFPVAYGAVHLKDDVWIPWNCFIMPGVTIGRRVVVGAGSVVTKSIPDGALSAGVPARIVRERSYREVSREELRTGAIGLIREYVGATGGQLDEAVVSGGMLCRVDGVSRFALVESSASARSVSRGAVVPSLILVLDAIDPADPVLREGPVCSLTGGLCCQSSRLDATARGFLQFSRRIGLRHYPVDEYLDSEALMAGVPTAESTGRH